MPIRRSRFRTLLTGAAGLLCTIIVSLSSWRQAAGPLYAALAAGRPAPAPVRELLAVTTDPAAPPAAADLAQIALALLEYESGTVLLGLDPADWGGAGTASPAGLEADQAARKAALAGTFDAEFGRISDNIAALFDGIRQGTVRSKDSARYVAELIALTRASEDRLLAAAARPSSSAAELLDGVLRLHGTVVRGRVETLAADRRTFPLAAPAPGEAPAPTPAFKALIAFLGRPEWTAGDGELNLAGARRSGSEPFDLALALDDSGGLVVEEAWAGLAVHRTIDPAVFSRAAELERGLYLEFRAMERAGYIADARSALSPAARYDYALAGQTLMLSADPADPAAAAAAIAEWRARRADYFQAAADFLAGGTETGIIGGYDSLLAAPDLTPGAAARISDLKREAAASFARARAGSAELSGLRSELRLDLGGAFVVIAPPAAAEAAAALVDAVLSGRTVRTADRGALLAAGAAGALAGALLAYPGNLAVLAAGGLAAVALSGGASFAALKFFDYYLTPAASVGALVAAALVGFALIAYSRRRPRGVQPAAAAVPGGFGPLAVLAVRLKGIPESPEAERAAAWLAGLAGFRRAAAARLRARGARLLASEGELVLGAFEENPPDAADVPGAAPAEPAARRACLAALDLAAAATELLAALPAEPALSLRLGIDRDLVLFGPADPDEGPAAGFQAVGGAVGRAKLLSSLAERFGAAALVTEAVRKEAGAGLETRRLDKLVIQKSGREEYFYSLSPAAAASGLTLTTQPPPNSGKAR